MTSEIPESVISEVRRIATAIVQGELHPLDGCRRLAEIHAEAGEPDFLAEFPALADIYEFHLDQPAAIRKIQQLAEELLELEFHSDFEN